MSRFGHKLTIRGEGPKGDAYKVLLDDQPLTCSNLSVSMGVGEPVTVELTLFVSELDMDTDDVVVKG